MVMRRLNGKTSSAVANPHNGRKFAGCVATQLPSKYSHCEDVKSKPPKQRRAALQKIYQENRKNKNMAQKKSGGRKSRYEDEVKAPKGSTAYRKELQSIYEKHRKKPTKVQGGCSSGAESSIPAQVASDPGLDLPSDHCPGCDPSLMNNVTGKLVRSTDNAVPPNSIPYKVQLNEAMMVNHLVKKLGLEHHDGSGQNASNRLQSGDLLEKLKSDLESCKAENEKLSSANSWLRGKNQELELIADEAEKFEMELSEIKARHPPQINLEKEVERLQSEQSCLLARNHDLEVMALEVESLRAEVARLRVKNQELQSIASKTDLSEERSDLKTKMSTLQKRLDWYEQVRDWISCRGEDIMIALIERGAAPTPFHWGGKFFEGATRGQ